MHYSVFYLKYSPMLVGNLQATPKLDNHITKDKPTDYQLIIYRLKFR